MRKIKKVDHKLWIDMRNDGKPFPTYTIYDSLIEAIFKLQSRKDIYYTPTEKAVMFWTKHLEYRK